MLYQTKIGLIEIQEENEKITKVHFIKQQELETKQEPLQDKETPLIKQTYMQITEYLEGKRRNFTIPIQLKGTPFQIKVWQTLQQIPYGETRTYQDIAITVGSSKACRAVGMANHNNSIAIIVPCHRVIGKNNKLVGYAGGLDIKEQLLFIEKNHITNY